MKEVNLFLLLSRMSVEIDPSCHNDAKDKDNGHNLIEKCPAECHLRPTSFKPITTEKQNRHSKQTHYNTRPARLSTDRTAHN